MQVFLFTLAAELPRIYEDFFCDFIIKVLPSQGIHSSRYHGSVLPAFGLATKALSNTLCTAAKQSVLPQAHELN